MAAQCFNRAGTLPAVGEGKRRIVPEAAHDAISGGRHFAGVGSKLFASNAVSGFIFRLAYAGRNVEQKFGVQGRASRVAEIPEGSDGNLIACVRNLRRYLLLVEAEMTEHLTSQK